MNKDSKKKRSIIYAKPYTRKDSVVPTKKYATQRDLS
jgi:hypothetical protein